MIGYLLLCKFSVISLVFELFDMFKTEWLYVVVGILHTVFFFFECGDVVT